MSKNSDFDEDADASEVTKHTESGDNDSTNGGKTGSNSDHKFWHKKDLKGLRKNARYYTKEEDLDILKYIKDNDMFAPL